MTDKTADRIMVAIFVCAVVVIVGCALYVYSVGI